MPRASRDEEKENWSPFGKFLHEEFLDRDENNIVSQKTLAEKSEIDAGVLSHMVTGIGAGNGFRYGQKLYNHLYRIFTGLAKLQFSISDTQAGRLLATIPTRPSLHLTDTQKDNLIAQLIEEGIVKPLYFTKAGLPLIGRHKDIEAIYTQLQEESPRFLTLIGLPGVGKTELARQIEDKARKGAYFTSIVFLSVEGIKRTEEAIRKIYNYLPSADTQKRTLLILDNCEEITDMATARSELYTLLGKHTQLTILATSRVVFSLAEYKVPHLDLPHWFEPPEKLQGYDAVQLLLKSANANGTVLTVTKDNARTIASLCIDLDGLPLALLMAGSWAQIFSIEKVYDMLLQGDLQSHIYHLRDSERHITLDRVIEASYLLLSKQEQRLFRRLAMFYDTSFFVSSFFSWSLLSFTPSCTIEAAAAICLGADAGAKEFLNSATTLRNHNLVTITKSGRISIIHNTIYHYAIQKLKDEDDEEQIRKQFIDYFYRLVTEFVALMEKVHAKYIDKKELDKKHKEITREPQYHYELAEAMMRNRRDDYITSEVRKLVTEDEYQAYIDHHNYWRDTMLPTPYKVPYDRQVENEKKKKASAYYSALSKVESEDVHIPYSSRDLRVWDDFWNEMDRRHPN